VLSMASGATINAGTGVANLTINDGAGRSGTFAASGDITLGSITAGTLSVNNAGLTAGSDVIVQSGSVFSASGAGRAIDIRALNGTFTNNAGAGLRHLWRLGRCARHHA
jgi:hypothetical protein